MKGCIIVPYRNRAEHLAAFLGHYKDVLPIYVIEQEDGKPFNRAKLLNIGFLEIGNKYEYAIYHDVDMLAETFEAYELYPDKPMHMATACSQFNYKMPYPTYFGGVTSISSKDMVVLNGFSNEFYSHGGEDDEMFNECIKLFGKVHSVQNNRYKSLSHPHVRDEECYKKNLELLKMGRSKSDGLSNCTYRVISKISPYHIIVSL